MGEGRRPSPGGGGTTQSIATGTRGHAARWRSAGVALTDGEGGRQPGEAHGPWGEGWSHRVPSLLLPGPRLAPHPGQGRLRPSPMFGTFRSGLSLVPEPGPAGRAAAPTAMPPPGRGPQCPRRQEQRWPGTQELFPNKGNGAQVTVGGPGTRETQAFSFLQLAGVQYSAGLHRSGVDSSSIPVPCPPLVAPPSVPEAQSSWDITTREGAGGCPGPLLSPNRKTLEAGDPWRGQAGGGWVGGSRS